MLAFVAGGLRLLAPVAVELAVERLVSQSVRGVLELDDVDLSLLDRAQGTVHLEGIRFARKGAVEDDPAVRIDRLTVAIAWRPLLTREVRLRSIEMQSPSVVLERDVDGRLDILNLIEPVEPVEPSNDQAEASDPGASDWTFALDEATVETGRIRLIDLAVEERRRWRTKFSELSLQRAALEPGTYEEPARLQFDGTLEGAPLSLEGTWRRSADGARIDLHVEVEGLPIEDAALYASELGLAGQGWGAVRGQLDADLDVRLGAQSRVSGDASLSQLSMGSTDTSHAALELTRMSVEAGEVDFDARHVGLDRLSVEGARLVARRAESGSAAPTLPLLEGTSVGAAERAVDAGEGATPETRSDASTSSGSGAEPAAAEPAASEAEPWSASIDRLDVTESRVVLASDGSALVLRKGQLSGLDTRGEDRSERADIEAHLELVVDGETRGAIDLTGRFEAPPVGFGGELRWRDVDVVTLGAAFVPPAELAGIESVRTAGRLDVRLPDDGDPVAAFSGVVELNDFATAGGEETVRCTAGFRSLRVPIDAARVGVEHITIRLGRIELEEPEVRLVRRETGIACEMLGLAPSVPETGRTRGAPGGGDAGDASKPITPEASGSPDEGRSAIGVLALEAAGLDVSGGQLTISDRTVSPFVETKLRDLEGSGEGITWRPRAVESFEVSAEGVGREPLEISGAVDGKRVELEVDTEQVDLPRLNPYSTSMGGFAVEEGRVSASLDLAAKLPDAFEGDARIVLHDVEVTGVDEQGFRQRFGVRLPLAMAMLRNVRGDIVIDAPFAYDREEGTQLRFARIVGGAVRRAMLNTVLSPLKLIGAVATAGEKVETFEPEPVRFVPGAFALTEAGQAQVRRLAQLLARRPWLSVHLRPLVVERDADAREPAPNAAEQSAANPREAAEAEPRGDRRELARLRGDAVRSALTGEHGLAPARVLVTPPEGELAAGEPRVAVSFEPIGDPTSPEDPDRAPAEPAPPGRAPDPGPSRS